MEKSIINRYNKFKSLVLNMDIDVYYDQIRSNGTFINLRNAYI